jgi:hypothetical protein
MQAESGVGCVRGRERGRERRRGAERGVGQPARKL